ncbi:MAG: recombinase family protein [Candidatus Poribacteria bacterium]
MRTFAYMEGSSDIEDLQKQKQAILAFAKIKDIYISRFIEVSISKQITNEQKSNLLMGQSNSFDMLIVSDLSRIAHSVAEIITTVNTLVKNGVRFVAIEEEIDLCKNNEDEKSQVMVKMFERLAQIEQKRVAAAKAVEAFAIPKARGRNGGRPRTDPKKLEQAATLYQNSNQTAAEICQAVGIGRRTLFRYLSKLREQTATNDG